MRNTLLALALGFAGIGGALAQPVPLPLDGIGGTPVPAHYVRLEGGGADPVRYLLTQQQELCARWNGVQVDLPADSELVVKITRDEYYTATHLIVYKRQKQLFIATDCSGTFWREKDPEIVVTHPGGACTINVKTRVAIGYGCDPSIRSAAGRTVPNADFPLENLGKDGALDCVRTAAVALGQRVVQCVQPQPEPWLSFKYRAAGSARQGILLEDKGIYLNDGKPALAFKAVEVRKNITIGSDMLDLAHTQGFTVIGTSQKRLN